MPRPPYRLYNNDWFLPAVHYPHMQITERYMFRSWLISCGQDFDGFMFDVRVGNGKAADGATPDNIKQMWTHLTKKRIDVLGFKATETWLFEIKKNLNMGVLAQLEVYAWLLLDTYFPDGILRKAMIVGDLDPDLLPIAKEKQIEIFVVPIPVLREARL